MEVADKEIYYYINNEILDVEKAMKDYRNYMYTIIRDLCRSFFYVMEKSK